MKYTILVPSTLADHPIIVLDLGSIDVVDLFAAVLLTDPLGRAVLLDRLLDVRTQRTNR